MLIERMTSLGRRYRHFHRYREIVAVLLKHGFGDLLRRLGLHRHLRLGRWRHGRDRGLPYIPTPYERVRLALEELGPSFVKLGQVLSTRHDLLPPDLVAELEKLQDAVAPFPSAEARAIVEADQGHPIGELFQSFHDSPLASASIAQVHEAVTRDGQRVVVKVRRPRIEALSAVDIEIMTALADLLERLVPEATTFEPGRVVRGFARILRRELDFGAEASHIERFARHFAGDARLRVPRVFRDLSSERVLTLEYIDGTKVSHAADLQARGLDPGLIAARGAELLLEQVFLHGFFHADPHPGNLLVLPDNVVCFLDYGMMGTLTHRQREQLSDLIIGLATSDEHRIALAATQLAGYHHPERLPQIEAEVTTFVETYLYRPLKEIRIGVILSELTRLMLTYDIHLPHEFFVLTKALTTIDGVGRRLVPDFQVMGVAEPFARRLVRARLDPRRVLRQAGQSAAALHSFLRDLPAQAGSLLAQLRNGDLRFKFEHRGLEKLTHALDQVSNRIAFAIVLAALLVGSAIMVHAGTPPRWHGLPLIGVIGFSLSGLMGFSLLWSILKHGKM